MVTARLSLPTSCRRSDDSSSLATPFSGTDVVARNPSNWRPARITRPPACADSPSMKRAALAFVIVLTAVTSSAGSASTPTIALLAPADGAIVVSSSTTRPKFSWRLDFPEPQLGRIVWEIAADREFAKDSETLSEFCETDVNCWSSVTPQEVWSPPRGHVWYWRVGFTSSTGTVYSPTWSFSALSSDGLDRTAPRVQVLTGSARRGSRAGITARISDDRLFVRAVAAASTTSGGALCRVHHGKRSRRQPHAIVRTLRRAVGGFHEARRSGFVGLAKELSPERGSEDGHQLERIGLGDMAAIDAGDRAVDDHRTEER